MEWGGEGREVNWMGMNFDIILKAYAFYVFLARATKKEGVQVKNQFLIGVDC